MKWLLAELQAVAAAILRKRSKTVLLFIGSLSLWLMAFSIAKGSHPVVLIKNICHWAQLDASALDALEGWLFYRQQVLVQIVAPIVLIITLLALTRFCPTSDRGLAGQFNAALGQNHLAVLSVGYCLLVQLNVSWTSDMFHVDGRWRPIFLGVAAFLSTPIALGHIRQTGWFDGFLVELAVVATFFLAFLVVAIAPFIALVSFCFDDREIQQSVKSVKRFEADPPRMGIPIAEAIDNDAFYDPRREDHLARNKDKMDRFEGMPHAHDVPLPPSPRRYDEATAADDFSG